MLVGCGKREMVLVESLEFAITGDDFLCVDIVKLDGLLKFKEMLIEVGAFQRFGDVFLSTTAMGVTVSGEDGGVALSGKNGTDDGHAGGTGDVADDIVQLEVHQVEGFLHMLNVRSPVAQEQVPLASNGA